jgi:hypothetical protein
MKDMRVADSVSLTLEVIEFAGLPVFIGLTDQVGEDHPPFSEGKPKNRFAGFG